MYDSEKISGMIKSLEEHSYSYTHYKHQNGEGCINTEILLKQLKLNETEIRANAIDDFANTLIPRLTDAIYQKDVESMTNLINDIAIELKAGGMGED